MSTHAQAIKQDAYDRLTFGSAVQDIPELGTLNRRSAQSENVLRDVHASLYKLRPQIDDETTAGHRGVIEQLMETDEYQMLRATTRMSEIGAALGTLSLGRSIMQHLPEEQDEQEQESGQPGEGGDDDGWGQLLNGCPNSGAQRRKLRKMAAQAQEETEENIEAVQGLTGSGWGSGPGENSEMSLKDAMQLAQRLRDDPRLQRIAQLAGRMRRRASGKRDTRLRRGPDDVVGVELGNDLAKLLPSELQAFVVPELRTLAILRFIQKRMLQLQREGKEKADQGPIVVLVDGSGSMTSRGRDEWSKAVALGVMSIAKKENREFACGTFSDYCSLSNWGKSPSMQDVLAFLSRSPSGGTNFQTALDRGLKVIEEAQRKGGDWEKADIVFITDGDCAVWGKFEEQYKARAKATGAHLYVVGIGCEAHSLDSLADGSAYVTNLNDDNAAIELAFGI